MKKSLIAIMFIIVIGISGCSHNVVTKEVQYNELEKYNLIADVDLFNKCEEVYKKNMKKAKTNEEKHVVVVKFADDLNKVASNRVNLDLEILNVFSKEYQKYVITLQVFSENYYKKRKELIKNYKIKDVQEFYNSNIGKGYLIIEEAVEQYVNTKVESIK